MNKKTIVCVRYFFAVTAAFFMLAEPESIFAAEGINNAQFVSQSVPAAMVAGKTYSVAVTMKNTGTSVWTAAKNYRLGAQNPQDNTNWGVNRVYLASSDSVARGKTKTFVFNVTAPSSAGTYYFQWQMVREYVQWFGGKSRAVAVKVCANECQTGGITRCGGIGYQICGNYDSDPCLEWSSAVACAAEKICSEGVCVVPAKNHQIVTQYWGWLGDGVNASTAGWDSVTDGIPAVGARYYSGDPAVAEKHLQQMKNAGINVVSFGWLNQKQEGPVWYDVNPDDAFQEGMMKAASFKDMKFSISYDLASRAWLVHLAENGIHPVPGTKIDVIPGIEFNDPQLSAAANNPSYDFSLTSNGKYIYDELLSYDFDYLARNYLNQPNYQKIGGKAVVYLYATSQFNNGKNNADLADGFGRALNRVRTEVYNKYGIVLYLVGDFAKYHTTYWQVSPAGDSRTLIGPQDYKDWGYLQHFDAVGSWNNFQGLSYESLSSYTDTAQDINSKWQAVAFLTNRDYRKYLTGSVKTAYGSENTRLDYIPALVYSFRSYDAVPARNLWSLAKDLSEVSKQTNMVKQFRDSSVCAEESTDVVYQVAWNQWGEGQMIEDSVEDAQNPYPGAYGSRYLNSIRDILAK